MLQVWKITIPSHNTNAPSSHGWALAHTAEEAKALSGFGKAVIQQMPEHIWIVRERIIWVNQTAT
ncbi:hypothetical protein [Roseovarius aestuarii]|uniref:hypothetical protein n=1 Tax=Roseovarius aestuarii TaxID=475083 RepID=UPI00111C76BC|nr:hypothetical protein [Roseovarius aestuarii]